MRFNSQGATLDSEGVKGIEDGSRLAMESPWSWPGGVGAFALFYFQLQSQSGPFLSSQHKL